MPAARPLFVVLGNQLFPLEHLEPHRDAVIFMAEDVGLCTYVRHHQQKIVLFLAAMRAYRDALIDAGFDVRYHELEPDTDLSYEDRLQAALTDLQASELRTFEIEDRPMELRIEEFATANDLSLEVLRRLHVRSKTSVYGGVLQAPAPATRRHDGGRRRAGRRALEF